jgi:hypothetical protein
MSRHIALGPAVRTAAVALLIAGSVALAACRGGHDAAPTATPAPPATPTATPARAQSAADQAAAARAIATALPAEIDVLTAAEAGAMPELDGLFIDVAAIGLDYGRFTMPPVSAATGITIAPIQRPSFQVNMSLNPTIRMPARPAPGATPPPGSTPPPSATRHQVRRLRRVLPRPPAGPDRRRHRGGRGHRLRASPRSGPRDSARQRRTARCTVCCRPWRTFS